jgi:hypothetical protein
MIAHCARECIQNFASSGITNSVRNDGSEYAWANGDLGRFGVGRQVWTQTLIIEIGVA